MATKKKPKATEWPQVNKGSHLTVYTYEDGSTKLEWDDKALHRDVNTAIMEYAIAQKKAATPAAKKTKSKK